MLLAKKQGGTTLHGYTWENDDDAVDVPYDLAMELVAIKGGGFYVPEAADADLEDEQDPGGEGGTEPDDADPEITEPDPSAELSESPKPRRRRKPAAPAVEETGSEQDS